MNVKKLRARKCQHCGKSPIHGYKFCSLKCAQLAAYVTGKTRAQLSAEARERRTYTCKGCGEQYIAKFIDRDKYCSRECGNKNATVARNNRVCDLPAYCKVYSCVICDRPIAPKRSGGQRIYCSRECQKAKGRQGWRLTSGPKRQRRYATVSCTICGIEFSRLYGNKKRVCSHDCEKEQIRKHRRIAKAVRRARMITGEGEAFDPYNVFRRDMWKCKSCGCDTPMKLRGTNNDSAPELDHIIPLSKGGKHTMANTQCLCRKCNGLKSDKTMEVFIEDMGYAPSIPTASHP